MKAKEQVIFDIGNDKFRYLHREDIATKNRVDINELNKKLNHDKKINFYTNTKLITVSLLALAFFTLISLKF